MKKALSSQAAAAAAIKAELKALFPETKFSVTSESFSMGDAVRVHWMDGPSGRLVDLVVNKYEYGHFDGMTDMYEYSNRRDDIPQVKYVSTQRVLTVRKLDPIVAKIKAEWDVQFDVSVSSWGHYSIHNPSRLDPETIERIIEDVLRDEAEAEVRAFEEKQAKKEKARKDAEISEEEAWRQKNVPALRKIWNDAEKARADTLDLGAGQALECKAFFSAAEERGLSALADYYDEEARRVN